ncbi:hypothetical protein [Sulfolobus acidocaldarius]|nr:hypothetical protein [Sulfolobus acidocaldarius]AGE71486.1 hypothetical protein SacN8_07630 [Sulfolobus acidocaldarius N8]AGE73759.1 hypothetical protein SacRon12I_07640 [Sulfolobus acidocaldarius Ron12/I]WCM35395.1 hypothetical protein GO597_08700 [Sulfolobus acidocaldarius DSM 639]ALU30281.1 hypothetical protein ATY89_10240 [Sulfolobus acidocaldarius]ALU30998.1 hypothetical protein ATZ20_01795 [Sulfolobus acidocaldarius]
MKNKFYLISDNPSDMINIVQEILEEPSLIFSYYNNVKIVILLNLIKHLRSMGKEICIVNLEKIKPDVLPPDFHSVCNEKSEVIVYEAEDEKEVPVKFTVIISSKKLKLGVRMIQIDKLGENLYKMKINNNVLHLFRVLNDYTIKEEQIGDVENEILKLLREYQQMSMREIVQIIAHKTNSSREEVRNKLYFLKTIGAVEIKEGIVSLNDYGWSKR